MHSREIVQVARVRAEIDDARQSEKQRPNDAVGKHLQNRTRDAEKIGRRQPKQDKAHVTHARITNDEFEIVLTQCDCCRVNDPDHRQHCDPPAPHVKA